MSNLLKDEEYNIYYGVPHSHTSYSDGKGTPTDAYEHARNEKLDFLIITDHVGKLIGNNYNYDNSILFYGKKPKWEMSKLEADRINAKYKDFVALVGFELSTKFSGHINVLNSKDIVNKRKFKIKDLYEWLHTRENIIISINHPYRTSANLPYSKTLDETINLIEVGHRGKHWQYVRCEEYYYKALDEGWHIGAINSQDNHNDNWGDEDNLTGVITDELSEKGIISAIRMRRVFSTESRTLRLILKGNGQWMGSMVNLKKDEKLDMEIKAEDKFNPIYKVQIISNGGKVIKEYLTKDPTSVEYNISLTPEDKNTWYLVKVIHTNNKVGISSPIFT